MTTNKRIQCSWSRDDMAFMEKLVKLRRYASVNDVIRMMFRVGRKAWEESEELKARK